MKYSKKKKSTFQKITMVVVWLMIIVTLLSIFASAAGSLGWF